MWVEVVGWNNGDNANKESSRFRVFSGQRKASEYSEQMLLCSLDFKQKHLWDKLELWGSRRNVYEHVGFIIFPLKVERP